MSLVERIVKRNPTTPAVEPDPISRLAPVSGPRPASGADGGPFEVREFTLDYAALARHGFVVPGGRRNGLSSEIGSVRRHLLRELGLFSERRGSTRRSGRTRRVLVTSAHPGEGKTFSTINLALSSVFEDGTDTVLVDADLARAELGRRMGLPKQQDDFETPRLFRATDCPLSVVPAFLPPRLARRTESRQKMLELLDVLSARSGDQLILIDSPPIRAMADAAFLAAAVDHVILVVGAGMSTPEDIESSLRLLAAEGRTSLLLNRNRFRDETSSAYDYYYYYHHDHAGETPA
jgi:Mrp family chromosome partitioning ATPase